MERPHEIKGWGGEAQKEKKKKKKRHRETHQNSSTSRGVRSRANVAAMSAPEASTCAPLNVRPRGAHTRPLHASSSRATRHTPLPNLPFQPPSPHAATREASPEGTTGAASKTYLLERLDPPRQPVHSHRIVLLHLLRHGAAASAGAPPPCARREWVPPAPPRQRPPPWPDATSTAPPSPTARCRGAVAKKEGPSALIRPRPMSGGRHARADVRHGGGPNKGMGGRGGGEGNRSRNAMEGKGKEEDVQKGRLAGVADPVWSPVHGGEAAERRAERVCRAAQGSQRCEAAPLLGQPREAAILASLSDVRSNTSSAVVDVRGGRGVQEEGRNTAVGQGTVQTPAPAGRTARCADGVVSAVLRSGMEGTRAIPLVSGLECSFNPVNQALKVATYAYMRSFEE